MSDWVEVKNSYGELPIKGKVMFWLIMLILIATVINFGLLISLKLFSVL